jgi:lysozyme
LSQVRITSTRKILKRSAWPVLGLFLCLLLLGVLLYEGIIWPNDVFVTNYHVRGIDVSSYQQRINWRSVAQSGEYAFAYIKATEGTTYQDAYFQANWRDAKIYGLLRGAYHYFLADVSGSEQADHYISTVPKEGGTLPPMLDLEVTGKDHTSMLREIKAFLDRLEQYYGMKPLIYTDSERYSEYIQGHFEDYPLTIRDVITPVQWSAVKWTFWQYADHGQVPGIAGFVDLDAFYGQSDQLKALAESGGHPG